MDFKKITGKCNGPRVRIVALLLMLPLLGCMLLGQWWLDRWALGVAFDAYFSWGRLLANGAVGLAAYLLLAGLTRRLLLSWLLVSAVLALLYMASEIKYRLLGMPVMLPDLYFLRSIDASSLQLFSGYLSGAGWQVIAGLLAGLALLAGVYWAEPRWCASRGTGRWLVLVSAVALLVSLYLANWPWTSAAYSKQAIRPSPLGAVPAVLHGGLVSSLVHYHGQQRNRSYEADAAALRQALQTVNLPAPGGAGGTAPAGDKPDVIIILSESFMDPHVLKGMAELPDLIPNMRAAIQAGQGGMMHAPTFGGGTVRTEFEVLTGLPVAAFEGVYYPYVDLNVSDMPGVVSELKARGYASLAMHGNTGSFWNRTSTYRAMGIDRFLTQRHMLKLGAKRDGGWISDRSMTDILVQELNASTQPTVAVAISIQAHGPYNNANAEAMESPAARDAIAVPASLPADAARELRNYLYHLSEADKELGRLVAALQARQRPFVLLFFGDHLPAFEGVYDKLGFVDGREASEQYVPWLLLGNRSAETLPSLVQAWELPAWAMLATGESEAPWFGFSRRAGRHLDPASPGPTAEQVKRGLHAGANARLAGQFDRYVER